jgi:hypothetical protein
MALEAAERFGNVVSSLYAHIDANYSETAFHLAGEDPLNASGLVEWVEFSAQIIGRQFRRVVSDDISHGNDTTVLLECLIVRKPRTNILRQFVIADTIRQLFRNVRIQIQDDIGGTGNLGFLVGDGVQDEGPAPVEDDLTRYLLALRLRYLEQFDPY